MAIIIIIFYKKYFFWGLDVLGTLFLLPFYLSKGGKRKKRKRKEKSKSPSNLVSAIIPSLKETII
jgi:hypothetical protein